MLKPRGKNARYPLYRRLGGPQSWSEHRGYRKNSLPLPGIKPQSPGHPACSQTLYWLRYLVHQFIASDNLKWFEKPEEKQMSQDLTTASCSELLWPIYIYIFLSLSLSTVFLFPSPTAGWSTVEISTPLCSNLCSRLFYPLLAITHTIFWTFPAPTSPPHIQCFVELS
jgi:hypothetical protein